LAPDQADGTSYEDRFDMISRVKQYAASISECHTSEELRELLRNIIGAGFNEDEFSNLYALVSARHATISRKPSP
jgi:hypothetical protein